MGVRLDKLLGKSPYSLVRDMMSTTNKVTQLIPKLLLGLKDGDLELCNRLSEEISQKEGEIDEMKHKIRIIVSQSMFFPFPKRDFLELIYTIDSISDRSETVAKLFTIRHLSYPAALEEKVNLMLQTIQTLREYLSNIFLDELNDLVESSFSGPEAQAVHAMIDGISKKAHELEVQTHEAMVVLYQDSLGLAPTEVILWNRIIDKLESVGLAFEKTATALRLLMEK